MKKSLFVVAVCVLVIGLVGCGTSKEVQPAQNETAEIVEKVHTKEEMEERVDKITENLDQKVEEGIISAEQKDKIIEKVESKKEKAQQVTVAPIKNNEIRPNTEIKKEKVEEGKIAIEQKDEKIAEEKGGRGENSSEKIEAIIEKINQKVAEGKMTAEERDKILEEIKKGNMKGLRKIMNE